MRTILLDRDGVINENRTDHVTSWDEFRFLPGALAALRLLTRSGFRIFVITNQAIINRGITTRAVVEDMHDRMVQVARRHGATIHAVRYCPHRPAEQCACRKPQPGMLLDLAHSWGFDLRGAYLVGDALSDIEAGRAVGCRSILVHTGRGAQQAALPQFALHRPDYSAPHLLGAAQWALQQEGLTLTSTEAPQRELIAVSAAERENWR